MATTVDQRLSWDTTAKNLVEQTAIILNSDGILIKSILKVKQNLWKMVVGSKVSLGRFNIKMDQIVL